MQNMERVEHVSSFPPAVLTYNSMTQGKVKETQVD